MLYSGMTGLASNVHTETEITSGAASVVLFELLWLVHITSSVYSTYTVIYLLILLMLSPKYFINYKVCRPMAYSSLNSP